MNITIQLPRSFKLSRIYLLFSFFLFAAWFSLQNNGDKIVGKQGVSLGASAWEKNSAVAASMDLGTFFPPNIEDQIQTIEIDNSGAIYVAGKTTSTSFPLKNAYQSTYGGGESDGFLTVFAPDGQSLLFSTYLGGTDEDSIKDIAISQSGHIFLTGTTASIDFPLANSYQPTLGGAVDVFVTVFEPDFSNLLFSTYIGGSDLDYPDSIAIEPDGSSHIVGHTYSTNYPVQNPIQTYQAGEDIFVTGFSADGQSLTYSTYIGGGENERAHEIVSDSNGQVFFAGYTESADFPIINAYQPTIMGNWDGFVTGLSANGQTLIMSTFIGGSLTDSVNSIQLDNNNRIHIGGSTGSDDFPVVNPYQAIKHGGGDSFLTIFNLDGQSLAYSTFLGGAQSDSLQRIAIDEFGRVHAVGYTYSTDFPLVNPYQPNNNGFTDIFVTSFENDGQSLFYSTYLGGMEGEIGYDFTLGESGLIYIGGMTWSADFPLLNAYQPELTGRMDGLATILSSNGQSLEYSTYFGGAYPALTDVSLTNLTGMSDGDTGRIPSWVWLLAGLGVFFLASLFLEKIIGHYKK